MLIATAALAAADDGVAPLNRLLDTWVAARNANDEARMKPIFDDTMDQIRTSDASVIATSAAGTLK